MIPRLVLFTFIFEFFDNYNNIQDVSSKILKESPAQSSELALLISSGITDRSR